MNKIFIIVLMLGTFVVKAQKIDSIYINLYTDSLKKGTYNYINVDGLLSNGRYVPLDSSSIQFSASEGKFFGNSLWIDENIKQEKICIEVMLKSNNLLRKKFNIYIKKKPDDEQLKTLDELIK
ncbi:MAG: hypothetical protein IPJ81_04090 [Chitinophagaceae bacterium]|nr:hypothetical protein [Chitinophagaceae bacterium]